MTLSTIPTGAAEAPPAAAAGDRPLKVAFVYPGYWPYVRRGVERLIHETGVYLTGRGHTVHVITSKPGPARTEQRDGMTVHYLTMHYHSLAMNYLPLLPAYRFGLEASRLLFEGGYDVVHVFTYSFAFGAPLLQAMRHTPYLFHVIVDEPGWQPGWNRWLYGQLLTRAAGVATLTHRAADYIHGQFGVQPEVLPPPVNLDEFCPRGPKDTDHPLVLFPGDLGDTRKGGFLLLKAWNRVHRERPGARLVLAGPYGLAWNQGIRTFFGAIPHIVPDTAARDAIEVRGTGTLGDLPRLYSEAAVTVLPSVQEAFGMVVTESLTCGTPVVVSDDAGPNEILGGNQAVGRTVSLRDTADLMSAAQVDAFADAILQAIDLSAQPGTVGACRAHAEGWSVPTIGARTEALYRELAGVRV